MSTDLAADIRRLLSADRQQLSAAVSSLTTTEAAQAHVLFHSLASNAAHFAPSSAPRTAKVSRSTKETTIQCEVNLDGTGKSDINTGLGFFDHMLTALSKHSFIDINLTCKGDLHVDDHHTTEDCALAIGQAIDTALGSKVGIRRYGSAFTPLDEALSRAVVDISGRPAHDINLGLKRDMVGSVSSEMLRHALQSLAVAAKLTLHVDVLKGENDHHRAESAFKAVALAFREAVSLDLKRTDIPSTKGSL